MTSEELEEWVVRANQYWSATYREPIILIAYDYLISTTRWALKPTADTTPPTFTKPLAPLPEWLQEVDELLEDTRGQD